MYIVKQIISQLKLSFYSSFEWTEGLWAWVPEVQNTTLHTNEEWFKLLSPEQQAEINGLVEMRKALKEEIRFDSLDKTVQFPEGYENLDYEEKVDMLMREIDMYKREKAKKELETELLEDGATKDGRHEFVENMFQTTDPKLREGLIWKKLESLTAGDIYSMKAAGADLAELFLITSSWEMVSKDGMNTWDQFKVNFGKCKSADAIIWIGDIIDIENVSQISVNGVVGNRSDSPRPGYYTTSGKYLAVHDGYKVQILEKQPIWEEDKNNLFMAQKQRFQNIRWEDIRNVVYSLEDAGQVLPFTKDHDIKLIVWVFTDAWIEGVSFDKESQILNLPDGIDFSDTKEILSGYRGVRKSIVEYVLENKATANSQWESLVLDIPEYSSVLVGKAVESMLWANSQRSVVFDTETMTLSTTNNKPIQDILWWSYEYLGSGSKHLAFLPELQRASSENNVPLGSLITLIYKENGGWNPRISAPGSSAYGLGQMIDGTWETYGKWLNRDDAGDQLIATTRYMKAIKNRKNCPWEHVLAYYNTGEGIRNVSQAKVEEYASLNSVISKRIPWGVPLNKNSYFIAAVSYYNSISYENAKRTVL